MHSRVRILRVETQRSGERLAPDARQLPFEPDALEVARAVICQNCGHENPANAALCKNCGATIARRTLASPVSVFAAVVGGLVAGAIVTGLVWFAGASFDRIGLHSKEEFGMSQGSAWFYLATLLATCVALIVLFRRPVVKKMNGNLRAFLLVALFVMLGGMSLCNLFSSSALFLKA